MSNTARSLRRPEFVAVLCVVCMSLSALVCAQDSRNVAAQSAARDAESVPSQPSSDWYDPAVAATLHSMNPKNFGPDSSLGPDFGDGLLGDRGGLSETLADHGFAMAFFATTTNWRNLIDAPHKTNGSQAYIGQTFTNTQLYGVIGTYDLGRVGLAGAQIILDTGCSASTFLPAYARGCRILDLGFYQSFFNKRLELSAGFLPNDVEFVNTYVGGSINTGAFGPAAILPVQSGLSQQPGTAPGVNVTAHFTSNWYEKVGVQRSISPRGLVEDYSQINRSGLRLSEPGAKALVINEVGFRRMSSTSELASNVRAGGLYNWSDYANFRTGGTSPNYNLYVLGDQQLTRPTPTRPFRGWYGGFTIMSSPSEVNVIRRYYEARLYHIAPFESRPGDQVSFVVTNSSFSEDASRAAVRAGAYPPASNTTSATGSYAYKLTHGTYLNLGLSYTTHPSFVTEPGQGHDLNVFAGFSTLF